MRTAFSVRPRLLDLQVLFDPLKNNSSPAFFVTLCNLHANWSNHWCQHQRRGFVGSDNRDAAQRLVIGMIRCALCLVFATHDLDPAARRSIGRMARLLDPQSGIALETCDEMRTRRIDRCHSGKSQALSKTYMAPCAAAHRRLFHIVDVGRTDAVPDRQPALARQAAHALDALRIARLVGTSSGRTPGP